MSKIARGRGAKARVYKGKKAKTASGLAKGDLMKNKSGKVVSKKAHAAGKRAYKRVARWAAATKAARKALGIKGFCPIGGKTAKGQALLKKVRSLAK